MAFAVNVLTVIGAVFALTFVIVYARRPWWTSNTGRILMTAVAIIGVLFALRFVNSIWVIIPAWVWAVGYLILDAGLAGLLWLLVYGDKEKKMDGD